MVIFSGNHQTSVSIDWDIVKTVNKTAGSFNKLVPTTSNKIITRSNKGFHPTLYKDTVVAPTYRDEDEPHRYFVKSIASDLSVTSPFPDDKSRTFQDYFKMQYDITIQDLAQPLLCVQHLPSDLNFLVARNETTGCGAATGRSLQSRKKQKKHIEYLVPELCHVYPLPSSFWHKALYLPSVLHRLNQLLIAQELQTEINQNLEQIKTITEQPSTSFCSTQDFETTSKMILQSLTTTRARESFNLERLEMLGDSFLKFSTSCFLYLTQPSWNEGYLSSARSKMVRNSNLYQLGKKKGIPQMMSVVQFQPKTNWLPPGFYFLGDGDDENVSDVIQWLFKEYTEGET